MVLISLKREHLFPFLLSFHTGNKRIMVLTTGTPKVKCRSLAGSLFCMHLLPVWVNKGSSSGALVGLLVTKSCYAVQAGLEFSI